MRRRIGRYDLNVVGGCIAFVTFVFFINSYYWSRYCQRFPLAWPTKESFDDEGDDYNDDALAQTTQSGMSQAAHKQVPDTVAATSTDLSEPTHYTMASLSRLSPRMVSLASVVWEVEGARARKSRFLTIGVVTAKRSGDVSYLYTCLQTILETTTDAERREFNVVVFITDFDAEEKSRTKAHLLDTFPDLLRSGFLQVISTDMKYYPPLANLKRRYGDSESRIYWRSKQAIDYAYLWNYCAPLAEYVLHLEDDVLAGPRFFQKLKSHLDMVALRRWAFVQFNDRYNAVVFRRADLPQLVHFVLLFYDEFPIDWAMDNWRKLREHNDLVKYPEILFAHVGEKSSLEGQIRMN